MFKEYEEYFSTLKVDKSPHTVRSYTTILNRFVEYFNVKSIEDIQKVSESDIQNYLNYLASQSTAKNSDTGKATANAHYRVIKAFLNWLNRMGYIDNVATAQVRRYKEAKKVGIIFNKEERDAIILATQKRPNLQMMMAVLFYTGLRREEATNVKLEDIKNGYLLVHGKGNKERELALTPFVLDMINREVSKRKFKSDYLFISMRGGHQITTSSLLARVKVACRMGGIPEEKIKKIGAHSIRRSFACNLLLDGWSTFAIQKALGHENSMTTDRYVEPAKSLASAKALLNQDAPSWYQEG
jgi:integrase/recombinase XerD